MKYIDGVVKDEFGKPKRVGYPEEIQKLIAQEGGEAIKVKKLQPEINLEYSENVKKGNKSLTKQNYDEAMEYFSTALELKPNEKEPAEKIDKIKSLQESIDELHKTKFGE